MRNVFALLVTALAAAAGPIPSALRQRDVFVPPILYPHAGTVWTSGQTHSVTWDTTGHPAQITNGIGSIVLRFDGISTPVLLADNFNILDGKVEVTVPWVQTGSNYQLVLFGDSGNFSPEFTINQGH